MRRTCKHAGELIKKSESGFASLVTLFALPFRAIMPLWALLWLNATLFPQDPPFGLVVALDLPFFVTGLLSDITRHLPFSLAALLLILVTLIWLVARKHGIVGKTVW